MGSPPAIAISLSPESMRVTSWVVPVFALNTDGSPPQVILPAQEVAGGHTQPHVLHVILTDDEPPPCRQRPIDASYC
jgi:hypothetical protein